MTDEFTPGPWYMETLRTEAGYHFIIGPYIFKDGKIHHNVVGEVVQHTGSIEDLEVCKNNAYLMMSAPELLDALKWIVNVDAKCHEYQDVARAAIEKATPPGTGKIKVYHPYLQKDGK